MLVLKIKNIGANLEFSSTVETRKVIMTKGRPMAGSVTAKQTRNHSSSLTAIVTALEHSLYSCSRPPI